MCKCIFAVSVNVGDGGFGGKGNCTQFYILISGITVEVEDILTYKNIFDNSFS